VTLLADTQLPDAGYEAAAAEFSDREIAALIPTNVTINGWNRDRRLHSLVRDRLVPAVGRRVRRRLP